MSLDPFKTLVYAKRQTKPFRVGKRWGCFSLRNVSQEKNCCWFPALSRRASRWGQEGAGRQVRGCTGVLGRVCLPSGPARCRTGVMSSWKLFRVLPSLSRRPRWVYRRSIIGSVCKRLRSEFLKKNVGSCLHWLFMPQDRGCSSLALD